MKRTLNLSPTLALPLDFATEGVAVIGMRGAGKALALDTPIPTPTGWTTMGDVQPGDWVFDDTGRPTRVVFVSEVMVGHECYEVEFSDGTSIVADAGHLWMSQVREHRDHRRPMLVTTERMARSLHVGRERNHAIDNCQALDLPAADLPVHPYVLGAWLGDGASRYGCIYSADPQIIDEIESLGYPCRISPSTAELSSPRYRIEGLTRGLRRLDLVLNKHVPSTYLRASREQRLALLQGLMDTDGTVSSRGTVNFDTTSERLCEGVAELVHSLGWGCRVRKGRAVLNGVEIGPKFSVAFRPFAEVFRLDRKRSRVRFGRAQASRYLRSFVAAVRPVASVPVRCIKIDAPSHLFLASRSFIPTHNTTTEVVWCEELDKVGIPFVVIEPKGDWGGIRSSADGTKPGLSVPVFGGRDGDGPLTANLGPRLADMLVDLNISAVLDLSNLSIADKVHFITEFCNRLMFRHQHEPHVRCVVLEEAHRYIPQQVKGEMAQCKEAASAILLEGRAWGLGCWACTQRPARLHKDVLEEVGTAICHRLGVAASNDLETVQKWMKNEGLPVEARESLTKLANGEAWVLAPVSLGIAERVQVRARETFDSGATPLVGAKGSRPVVTMAEIDMASINTTLADVIEKAKAEDPRTLHARIRDLEKQLTKGDPALVKRVQELERELDKQRRTPVQKVVPQVQIQTRETEVRVVPDEVWEYIEQIRNAIEHTSASFAELARMSKQSARLKKLQGKGSVRVTKNPPTLGDARVTVTPPAAPPARTTSPSYPARPAAPSEGNEQISRGLMGRKIIGALIEKPDCDRKVLAMLCECHPTGKSFANTLSALRGAGYMEGGRLTDAGLDLAAELDIKAPADVWEHWFNHSKVGGMGRKILTIGRDARERGLDGPGREELADLLECHPTGKSYANSMSSLRALGLIERGWPLRLTDHFAEAAELD